MGDSSAYLMKRETIFPLSKGLSIHKHVLTRVSEHKPHLPGEKERLEAFGISMNEGQRRLNGLGVSRAFGDHFMKNENLGLTSDPYISERIELDYTGSILIVASDGVQYIRCLFSLLIH